MFDLKLAIIGFTWLTWACIISLLVIAVLILLPAIKKIYGHVKMEKSIARLGMRQLRNIVLDDGVDGKIFVEHLLLTPEGLLVLVKNWRNGYIFGGDFLDRWAQVINKKTYHFKNPLYALTHVLAALKYHAPNVSASAKILFTADCSFPKGQPESALLLQDIFNLKKTEKQNKQKPEAQVVNDELEQAWSVIKGCSQKADKNLVFEEKLEFSFTRIVIGFAFIALAIFFLYQQLLLW